MYCRPMKIYKTTMKGLNIIYAHLNYIYKYELMIKCLGPQIEYGWSIIIKGQNSKTNSCTTTSRKKITLTFLRTMRWSYRNIHSLWKRSHIASLRFNSFLLRVRVPRFSIRCSNSTRLEYSSEGWSDNSLLQI